MLVSGDDSVDSVDSVDAVDAIDSFVVELDERRCDDSFVRAYAVQEVSKAKERHANGAL